MNNKMASTNESVRLLKIKINKPQNIDESYATMMYEGQDNSYEDEIKYNVEENHDEEDIDGEEDNNQISVGGDIPNIALLPPLKLIEEGETDDQNELEADEAETDLKVVDTFLTEDQLAVIDTFIAEEHGVGIDEAAVSAEGELQDGEIDEKDDEETEEVKVDENKGEEGSDDTEMVEGEVKEEDDEKEQEDTIEGNEGENQQQNIVEMEASRSNALDLTPALISWCKTMKWHPNQGVDHQCSNSMDIPQEWVEDEQFQKMFLFDTLAECCQKFFHTDECESEDVCAEINAVEEVEEGDDNKEREGGGIDEEMVEEEEEEGTEKEQQHEDEDTPKGEEGENQQQDIVEEEAAKSNAPDVTPELISWCKNMKWHPDEGFTHCSNSMDIPQLGVEDETFQKMFFFDTLVECCQKFFHADQCENEDVCAGLNVVGEEEGIAFEKQDDGELEDEVPEDEGQPEDGTDEEVAEVEEVANEEEEGGETSDESIERQADSELEDKVPDNEGQPEDGTDEKVAEVEEVANEEEEGGETSDESNNKSSSTEGQGIQIDETNEKTNWEGFDEDMPHQIVKGEPEQPSSPVEAHDLSEAQGKDDYEGDGFGTMKYKLLRGKGEGGKSSANPFTTLGSGALMAVILLVVSCCYRRYRRRRYAQSKRPNRGNYAALGRDEFFNGTFSDDVSYGKDSDDDGSIESYGSDDEGHKTNLEMGGFHELDANGGLTLEEING
eukprot:CAMPEP_0201739740 /NCGR_PEP_ID=MMETSP0593-20130828/45943_1 /ASSEMBLY_ACC=CAM_ASM_000672 /TAXON_ID=267983 /ORGANISM="Skeletonema japonicum, Strain CCMP2506" /LENGTH=723 /DNA_ID=CAMNT_0048234033 /DNA_START=186 /DNA_END=2357 /DNA_ORIENTATION=+